MMHSPWSQKLPLSPSQTLKHLPQCCGSLSVSTQIPSQTCSPGPEHAPPVVARVVPVSVAVVVPVPVVVDEVSSPVEVVGSEVEVEVVVEGSEVGGVEVVSEEVEVEVVVAVDDMPIVLDIESVPVDAVVIDAPVVAVVVSSSEPPLQANRARLTSAEITTGVVAWTWRSGAAQNGQLRSLSRT
jgi:hypothetical protein